MIGPRTKSAVRVHPHDLDEGQGPYPGRVIIRPQEHGQVGRDAQEREDLGTRRDPPAQQRQRRQPACGPDPARPAAIACRRTDQRDGRAHPCGQQDDPGHTARAVRRRQDHLEQPLHVDPGPIRRGVRERVERGDLAMSHDPLTGAHVPPDIHARSSWHPSAKAAAARSRTSATSARLWRGPGSYDSSDPRMMP